MKNMTVPIIVAAINPIEKTAVVVIVVVIITQLVAVPFAM